MTLLEVHASTSPVTHLRPGHAGCMVHPSDPSWRLLRSVEELTTCPARLSGLRRGGPTPRAPLRDHRLEAPVRQIVLPRPVGAGVNLRRATSGLAETSSTRSVRFARCGTNRGAPERGRGPATRSAPEVTLAGGHLGRQSPSPARASSGGGHGFLRRGPSWYAQSLSRLGRHGVPGDRLLGTAGHGATQRLPPSGRAMNGYAEPPGRCIDESEGSGASCCRSLHRGSAGDPFPQAPMAGADRP